MDLVSSLGISGTLAVHPRHYLHLSAIFHLRKGQVQGKLPLFGYNNDCDSLAIWSFQNHNILHYLRGVKLNMLQFRILLF